MGSGFDRRLCGTFRRCRCSDALVSFTHSTWFKTARDSPWRSLARLVENWQGGNAKGYALLGASDLPAPLDGHSDTSTNDAHSGDFADVHQMGLYRMSYDGTATTDNVKFYKGYRTAEAGGRRPYSEVVKLMSTHNANVGNHRR